MPLLDVILGYDCNLFCDYCTISPDMRARSLAAAQVDRAMQQARVDGFDRISFTGGEPTIRNDLLALVRRARQLGFVDVKLQSNGLLLGAGRNLDRLVEAGVTRFHVSIHTHDADAYETMVRRAGTHAAMVAGLRALVERGLAPVADVILERTTHPRLPDALGWLHGLGVRAADLWFVSLTDHNRDNVASMPRMTEVVPTVQRSLAWARAQGMTVRSLHIPRCLLGADHPHAWDPAAEGVRVVSPDATFDLRGSRLTGQIHVPACRGCTFEAECPGVRPDYLARYGDDEIAKARGHARGSVRRLPLL
jgi:MoaA/NifB/PqqE/SkfB family radical SAM enzyme